MALQDFVVYIYPVLILILSFLRIQDHKIDWYFRILILFGILSEISGYFLVESIGSNLMAYSIFNGVQYTVLALIVINDTKKVLPFIVAGIVIWTELILQIGFDFSLISIITRSTEFIEPRQKLAAQYFELTSLTNLIITVLSFYWIWWLVNSSKFEGASLQKRYIYAFSLLAYFCCGFFIITLPRLAMIEFEYWVQLWQKIFNPLFILYYLGLLIGILWKVSNPSSSQQPSSPS